MSWRCLKAMVTAIWADRMAAAGLVFVHAFVGCSQGDAGVAIASLAGGAGTTSSSAAATTGGNSAGASLGGSSMAGGGSGGMEAAPELGPALGGVGGAAGSPAAGAPSPPLAVIDTHTHYWDLSRDPGFSNGVTLLPSDYDVVARPAGIGGAIMIEAVWRDLADNLWGLELAENSPIIVGVVGKLSLDSPKFASDLAVLESHPLFRGLRITVEELASPNAQLLAEHGLVADVDTAGSAELVRAVASQAAAVPKLAVVLDHAGGLSFVSEPAGEMAKALEAAAQAPNVYCKVSRFQEQGATGLTEADTVTYARVLDFLLATFGEERLLFGTNWPLSEKAGSLGDGVAIMRRYFDARGDRQANAFFAGNATRIYGVHAR